MPFNKNYKSKNQQGVKKNKFNQIQNDLSNLYDPWNIINMQGQNNDDPNKIERYKKK